MCIDGIVLLKGEGVAICVFAELSSFGRLLLHAASGSHTALWLPDRARGTPYACFELV